MIKNSQFKGLSDCIEIANGTASVVVSTGFGPRVLSYALDGGENIFGWHPDAVVEISLGTWKPYGGHRLWLAPENRPLSYSPDNDDGIEWRELGKLSASFSRHDDAAGIEKRMTITLDGDSSEVTVDHRITNAGKETLVAAAWALSIMRPGGRAIVPNEPGAEYGPDTLLPVRSMALWSYTDLADPRWTFEQNSISLRVDDELEDPQKFGVLNKQGWAAYECDGLRFTKRFEVAEDAAYPDMNSNTEIYVAGSFAEVETLSPLKTLNPGEYIDHREVWTLETI